MKKVLFLIHDLGQGGAEKVLINLVNNMDGSQFDVTVISLFDVGVNKQFLSDKVKYQAIFSRMIPGNSKLMKLMSPQMLHKWFIKAKYDIEVAYLEGPCARIISGCQNPGTKLVSWIHIEQLTQKNASKSFRGFNEALESYSKFNRIICVSETVRQDFIRVMPVNVRSEVLYNTNETGQIINLSKEAVTETEFKGNEIKIVGVGKLLPNKGFDRLLKIVKRLHDAGYPVHLYILGSGSEQSRLENYIEHNMMHNYVNLLGYQTNPYKYIAKCNLFVCASHAEGFSTAATEALIVGTPVCTVEVSGMKEMLGQYNEYGVVTSNTDDDLYTGIKNLLDNPKLLQYYQVKAQERGKVFSTRETVEAVEKMFLSL